jgi:hypothetical protein
MTTAIFVVGIIAFLITLLGTIAVDGLLLTGSQLAGDPDVAPRVPGSKRDNATSPVPAIVNAES